MVWAHLTTYVIIIIIIIINIIIIDIIIIIIIINIIINNIILTNKYIYIYIYKNGNSCLLTPVPDFYTKNAKSETVF